MLAQSGRKSVAEEGSLTNGSLEAAKLVLMVALSSNNRWAQYSEFNELVWIMGEVETLFVGHRSDAPLLHSQRAE